MQIQLYVTLYYMWNYIKIYEFYCMYICIYVFFIFTTIFLSKQTNRIFQQWCRQVPEKSLECKWSPVVELSLPWVKPQLHPLTFPSSSVYRCSTVSWGIPKSAASGAVDLRQAEQWLPQIHRCSGLVISHVGLNPGSNPGTPVWAPQCGSHPSGLPRGNAWVADLCSLPRGYPTVTGVPWPSKSCCGYLTWQLKASGPCRASSFLIYQRLWAPCPPQQFLKG